MDRQELGVREYRALIGGEPGERLAAVRAASPEMYETMIESVFAGPLARPELARGDREFATVAMIAAIGGADDKLAGHVRAALGHGWHPSELRALAEHASAYVGFPRALHALEVIDQVVGVRPPVMRRVRASDHETLVASAGEVGPAVILSGSFGIDWRMWEPVMDRLAVGRRVFAYNLRGHGAAAGSPKPFTMTTMADDVLALMDNLGLDTAHVVGLSMGGGVAQTLAVQNPDRVDSLALLGTTDYPFTDAFRIRARSAEIDGIPAQLEPTLTRWFTPAALAANTWGVRYARERILRFAADDWVAAWNAFADMDVQGKLADFGKPVLILSGEKDASCTPEIMSGIADRIPGSTFQLLPDTPHQQTLEQPDLVADALDAFLPAQR
ncbi:alpha/beta hydrolase [Nocardia heshunensis]